VIDMQTYTASNLLIITGYGFCLLKPRLYSTKLIYLFSSRVSSRLLRSADVRFGAGHVRPHDASVRPRSERPAVARAASAVPSANGRYLFYDPLNELAPKMSQLAKEYSVTMEIRKEMITRGSI